MPPDPKGTIPELKARSPQEATPQAPNPESVTQIPSTNPDPLAQPPKQDDLVGKIQQQLLEQTKAAIKASPPMPLKTPTTQKSAISAQNLNLPKTKRSSSLSKFLLALLVVIFFLFATGLAFAYVNYPLFKPPEAIKNALDKTLILLPIPKPTRIILETAIARSADLKSAGVKSELSVSTDSVNSPIQSFKISVTGPVDFKDKVNQASEADISAEVKFEGASFNASASIKTIGDTIYFKINEFPFGGFTNMFVALKNRWFYYTIENYNPQQVINNDKIKEIVTKFIEKSQEFTESKSEDDVYVLEINPPKKDIDKLLYDLLTSYQEESKDQLSSSIEQENLREVTDRLQNLKITVHVDKKTYYAKKINFGMDITIENFSLPQNLGAESLLPNDNDITYKADFSTELSNYNKNLVIVPPEGAENFKSAIGEPLKNFSPNLQTQEQEQNDLENLEQLNLDEDLKLDEEESSIFNNFLQDENEVLGEKSSLLKILLQALTPPKSD